MRKANWREDNDVLGLNERDEINEGNEGTRVFVNQRRKDGNRMDGDEE